MKIRTDFVTNSSSSSFVVEIIVRSVKGKKFVTHLNPGFGLGDGDANILCTAEDVLKSDSIASLAKLLNDNIVINYPSEETNFFKYKVSDFFEKISEKCTSIDELRTITFRKIWTAWGESSSCFNWNLDFYAEELPELAAKVCESEGDEKEKAKKALKKYLSNYTGSIDDIFPSGFMGDNGKAAIVWSKVADDIEEFAQKVVSQDLPDYDYAEETTVVNFQTKKVKQKAEYILDGPIL